MSSILLYQEYVFAETKAKYVSYKFVYGSSLLQNQLMYRNVVEEYDSKPVRIVYPKFLYSDLGTGSTLPVCISYTEH